MCAVETVEISFRYRELVADYLLGFICHSKDHDDSKSDRRDAV